MPRPTDPQPEPVEASLNDVDDLVDEAGRQSFPASDPPAWHVPRVDARRHAPRRAMR